MVEIGKYNKLRIVDLSDNGLLFDGEEQGTILLPTRYVMPNMAPGEEVDVFIYNDSEDRIVATTEKPYATVGEFAYLEVVSVNERVGAFLNWGLSKDLLLPFREQSDYSFHKGDGAIVAIYLDEYTNRVAASTRLHRHLPKAKPSYEPNMPVHVLVYGNSPLGYKCIIDKTYRGLLYHTETSDQLEEGDQFTGYIKKVNSNGTIDLRRDPSGYNRVENISQQILRKLDESGGKLPFNDKTSPEAIRKTFNTSKKAFKLGIGMLYKQRKITLTDDGIERAEIQGKLDA